MKNFTSKLISVILVTNIQYFSQNKEPYQAKTLKPDSSKTIQSHSTREIEKHTAKEIEVYKAKTIEPYESKTLEATKKNPPIQNEKEVKPVETSKEETKPSHEEISENKLESLFGVWRTRVPGAVWQTPSGLTGFDNLHVSVGAIAGDLVIRKDGTYKWNSYGGKKGKWVKGDREYPIVLIDNVENKKWKVGFDSKHTGGRDIMIWDGNYWYDGKR